MKQVMLIDVMNLCFRVHFAHEHLSTKKGVCTSVLYGFMDHILYLNHKFPDTPMIFCFDAGHTWRHDFADKKYKRKRTTSEHRTKIYEQIEPLFGFLNCFGYHTLMVHGTEADDLIGILSYQFIKKHEELKVLIYSGDRDYFQLINDRVTVIKTQGGSHLMKMTEKELKADYGLKPRQWVRFRSLCGDASDSIKPVKGIGTKTAMKMIQAGVDASVKKFEDLPRKVRHTHPKLKKHWEAIHNAYILSKLPKDHEFKMFSKDISERVKRWIDPVVKRPKKRKQTKEQYRQLQKHFIKLAKHYELKTLIARRHDFQKIP